MRIAPGRRARALLALVLALTAWAAAPAWAEHELDLSDSDAYRAIQDYMLLLINQARTVKGAPPLRLDPLASQAAKQHADDMLTGDYFSHWDLEGVKPARRFNLLGGYDGLAENISLVVDRFATLEAFIDQSHATLMDSPGHRQAILNPTFTHVGLGFALSADHHHFYVDQEFISRVGGNYHCPLTARVGETVTFSGRFDPFRYELEHVVLFYEEPPQPRDPRWLAKTGSYQDGDKAVLGISPDPRLQFQGMATSHDLDLDSTAGTFACQVKLDFKGKPGMFYILLWLKDKRTGLSVQAATATVLTAR